MSVREYIGARYVMKFADPIQHDSTTAYEPLTVVQYQGASYISKQYVPIGISISNDDYWILLADFNSQIEQYREEVRTFDDRITANATDIDTIESKLPTSDFSSSSTVKDAIDAVSTNVTNTAALLPASAFTSTNTVKKYVDDKVATLENIKTDIVVLGDSLSTCSYDTDTNTVVSTGAELWTKVALATGLTVHNYAVGGAGFSYTGYTSKTVQNQLLEANDDTNVDEKLVKCVIAFAGTNDYLNVSTSNFQTAVANLINAYAGTKFAQAYVPFYIVLNQAGHGWHTNYYWAAGLRLGHFGNAKLVTILNGSSILKAFPSSFKYIAEDDGVHPSNYGYNALAQSFSNLIRGQKFLCDRGFSVTPITVTGITSSATAYVKDGHFYCKGSITLEHGTTLADNTTVSILRFKGMSGSFSSDNNMKFITRGFNSVVYEKRADAAGFKFSLTASTDGYDGILQLIPNGISSTGPANDIIMIFTLEFEL